LAFALLCCCEFCFEPVILCNGVVLWRSAASDGEKPGVLLFELCNAAVRERKKMCERGMIGE
jgi:hypothetical protein